MHNDKKIVTFIHRYYDFDLPALCACCKISQSKISNVELLYQ